MAQRKPTTRSTVRKTPAALKLSIASKPGQPHRLMPMFAEAKDIFGAVGAALGRTQGVQAMLRTAKAQADLRKFGAKAGQTLLIQDGGSLWLFAGLGTAKGLTRPAFCDAVGRGLTELRAAGAPGVSVLLPDKLPWKTRAQARYAGEAVNLAAYTFNTYTSKRAGKTPGESLSTVEIVPGAKAGAKPDNASQTAARAGLKEAIEVSAGVALTRDLINHPADVAHTDFMVDRAREVARAVKAKCTVIRGDDLLKKGYGVIHAVGRSGPRPPALVTLESGKRVKGRPTLALVGKGVVFDSGGLDLKTSSAMAMMKKDMSGAGIVLGAFRAIAGLGLPIHLVAVLGLAENMVGPDAFHPGDVLTSKAGLTIEITNTDAEGRLVLADAFALAHTFKPTHMVDFATLTGAARIALGKEIMALFCEDEKLRQDLEHCAASTGEALWALPMWSGYRKKMDSSIADLVNAAGDGMGGAITAALFLKEFAGSAPWAHLDCYGWSDGDQPLFPKGGSGIGVRLMVALVQKLLGQKGEE